MPSQNTYHLTWVSLTLDMGYLHGCSSKVQLLLFTLDEVTCDDLECGVAPLGLPALRTATAPWTLFFFRLHVLIN